MTEKLPVIQIQDLHKSYDSLDVLKGVGLLAYEGSVVSLIGASGSGKSTSLRCANLLENSLSGDILFCGDALYYASYLADKTFNPFIPYPILAGYFILVTVLIVWAFGRVNRRLNRHLPDGQLPKRAKFQFIR